MLALTLNPKNPTAADKSVVTFSEGGVEFYVNFSLDYLIRLTAPDKELQDNFFQKHQFLLTKKLDSAKLVAFSGKRINGLYVARERFC